MPVALSTDQRFWATEGIFFLSLKSQFYLYNVPCCHRTVLSQLFLFIFFENIKPKQFQCLSLDQFSAPMRGSLNPRPVYCLSQIHFTARSKHSHYIIWDVLQGRVIYIFSRSGAFRNGLGCTVLRCIGVLPQVNATPMGLCSVSRQSVGLD